MKRVNKFLKLSKYLLVGSIALTPVFFLTSCSSEPSFKTYQYPIKVGDTNIENIKSGTITTKVAQIVQIANNALYLNYSYEWKNLLLQSPNEEFEYLYFGSWTGGSGPFAGSKTGFGIKSIEIGTSSLADILNHTVNANTSGTFDVSSVIIKYGFYDGESGHSLSDLTDIQNRLKSETNFNTKFLPSKTEYSVAFNITMNIALKRDKADNDTDWQVEDTSTLTVAGKTVKGNFEIDKYVTDMSSLANKTTWVKKENIQVYEGLINSIS